MRRIEKLQVKWKTKITRRACSCSQKFAIFQFNSLFFLQSICLNVSVFVCVYFPLGHSIVSQRQYLYLMTSYTYTFSSAQITDFNAPCILHSLSWFLNHLFWKMPANETLPKHFFTFETLFVLGVCTQQKSSFQQMLMALQNKLENTYIGAILRYAWL